MSPPTAVYTRQEILEKYKHQLKNPSKYNCSLKSLTQLECTFKISPEDSRVQETICIPFKRVFQRCLVPHTVMKNSKKVTGERWINIEITLASTNDEMKAAYSKELLQFMRAEVDLKAWIESKTE